MAAAKELHGGDRVSWESSGSHSIGKVVRRQASPTRIEGHQVAASKDRPEFIVESDKSGKRAAHRAEVLKKLDG
jgi:hypothetical protein